MLVVAPCLVALCHLLSSFLLFSLPLCLLCVMLKVKYKESQSLTNFATFLSDDGLGFSPLNTF